MRLTCSISLEITWQHVINLSSRMFAFLHPEDQCLAQKPDLGKQLAIQADACTAVIVEAPTITTLLIRV